MPEERNKLKTRVRGAAIEEAESLSIRAEMPSGPVAESEGRLRRRCKISSSVQKRSGGQEEEDGGGVGVRGGVEELKQVEKKSLRRLALAKLE